MWPPPPPSWHSQWCMGAHGTRDSEGSLILKKMGNALGKIEKKKFRMKDKKKKRWLTITLPLLKGRAGYLFPHRDNFPHGGGSNSTEVYEKVRAVASLTTRVSKSSKFLILSSNFDQFFIIFLIFFSGHATGKKVNLFDIQSLSKKIFLSLTNLRFPHPKKVVQTHKQLETQTFSKKTKLYRPSLGIFKQVWEFYFQDGTSKQGFHTCSLQIARFSWKWPFPDP